METIRQNRHRLGCSCLKMLQREILQYKYPQRKKNLESLICILKKINNLEILFIFSSIMACRYHMCVAVIERQWRMSI